MNIKNTNFVPTPPDGDSAKQIPNGLAVLIHAVWQYWPVINGELDSSRVTSRQFGNTRIGDIVSQLSQKYPKATLPLKGAGDMPRELAKGEVQVTYIKLRAISEYIGIPLPLFILFSQMISIEREHKDNLEHRNEKLLETLNEAEFFISVLKDAIAEHSEDGEIFVRSEFDLEEGARSAEYLANLEWIKKFLDQARSPQQ